MRMIQTSTNQLNDVVKYLYNETSENENLSLESEFMEDSNLLDFYLDCVSLKQVMDKIEMQPSQESVDRIMTFSKNYEPTV